MKGPKVYHLARKYTNRASPTRQVALGTEFEQTKHGQSSSEGVSNIFRNNQQIRIRKLQLSKEKEYDIIGMRQLAIYNRLKDRKKRDLRSNREEHSFGTYFSARTSRLGSQPYYLTKDQVVKMHPQHPAPQKLNQSIHAEYLNTQLTGFYQQANQTSITHDKDRSKCKRQKFSFSKLKLKMEEYKRTWQKYTHRTNYNSNKACILKKFKRVPLDATIQCLSKSRDQSRDSRVEESIPWSQTLRYNNEGVTRGVELEIIEMSGFVATGRNKLQKQTQWIEEKHNQGYFFVRKDVVENKA